MRRCPKPGARTATASSVRCCVLATSMPERASTRRSRPGSRSAADRATARPGSASGRSGASSGLFVMKTYGFSNTVSMRYWSRTMYGDSQPFSTTMPSTKRTPTPGSSDSSIVTTPSAPTRSSASATMPPMTSSSLAAIVATLTRSGPSTGRATRCSSAATAAAASSMPRRSSIGFAPSSSARMPSRTIAWASSVAVVVPSPVSSDVLLATSRTSWAPMFLYWSESSISRAIVTPSLVIVGAPARRSSTTLRPFGPRVTLTVLASSSTPACSSRRASWLK